MAHMVHAGCLITCRSHSSCQLCLAKGAKVLHMSHMMIIVHSEAKHLW